MLAEAGCTVPEIAAVTGHSLKHVTHILEVYVAHSPLGRRGDCEAGTTREAFAKAVLSHCFLIPQN
jgi:hypothetical protein